MKIKKLMIIKIMNKVNQMSKKRMKQIMRIKIKIKNIYVILNIINGLYLFLPINLKAFFKNPNLFYIKIIWIMHKL